MAARKKTVAILESRLGGELAELIEKRGWRALAAPALAEVPQLDKALLARVLVELEANRPKVVIFQTGAGARALFAATDSLGLTGNLLKLLAASTVIVRGPKPTAVLRSRGVRIDRSAAEPYTTAQVLEAIADIPLEGERALVQRHGGDNPGLEQALRARGAQVIEIATYRWALPEDTEPLEKLLEALARGRVNATVFTSASQVHNLFALAQKLGQDAALAERLNRTRVASIGPVTSAALAARGVRVAVEANPPKLGPLLDALAKAFAA